MTARRAFPQANLSAVADAISAGYLTPLSTLRPDIDPALAHAIERSMARDPRRRFGSADQIRACLDAPAHQSRANWMLAATAVLVVLVLAVVVVLA